MMCQTVKKRKNTMKNQYNKEKIKEFINAIPKPADTESRKTLYSFAGTPAGKTMLDLGCGHGVDVKYFLDKNADIHGLDDAVEMINQASAFIPKSKLINATFENIPIGNEYFDIVYTHYGIYHSQNIETILREVHRILKPHGIFIIIVPHPIRQLIDKENHDYFKQEEYQFTFGFRKDKVTLRGISHTIQEYLCAYLLDNFNILHYSEKADPNCYYINNGWLYPKFLALKVQKKERK